MFQDGSILSKLVSSLKALIIIIWLSQLQTSQDFLLCLQPRQITKSKMLLRPQSNKQYVDKWLNPMFVTTLVPSIYDWIVYLIAADWFQLLDSLLVSFQVDNNWNNQFIVLQMNWVLNVSIQQLFKSESVLWWQFQVLLTLFSKFFSSFLHSTCLLSVSCQYLALDEI